MAKVRRSSRRKATLQRWHAVPLKGSFMVMSILGLLITLYLLPPGDYRMAFTIVFIAMFIASLISMTNQTAPMLR